MITISIKDEYAEVLTALGDLQTACDLALMRYAIEQITAKIAELRARDGKYQVKYGMNYSSFVKCISEDEKFISQLEEKIEKTWEIDLADWEFCHQGIKDWKEQLQNILQV